jgi:ribosomal protein S6E (S10)
MSCSLNSGATQYGVGVFGNAEEQTARLNSNMFGNGSAANMQHLALQSGGSRRRKSGRRQRKMRRGGSILVDVAVPAALVYANQMYAPKNAAPLSFRNRKSHKSRKSRKHHRR